MQQVNHWDTEIYVQARSQGGGRVGGVGQPPPL